MKELIAKSLLNKIERLEAFEDRMNIRFENFSIKIDGEYFYLYFELYPISGTNLRESVRIECVIYDTEGAILNKEDSLVLMDEFFGFEIMEFIFREQFENIGKIRVYPKKS